MPDQPGNMLRTFRLDKTTMEDLSMLLQLHPEVGSLNHMVNVALKEFITLHKNDKSWLKMDEAKQP